MKTQLYKLTYGRPDVRSGAVAGGRFGEGSGEGVEVAEVGPDQLCDLLSDSIALDEFRIDRSGEKPIVQVIRKYKRKGFFFGFGDKVGPMDRRGRKYVFWNTDNYTHHPTADPLYKSFPFFIYVPEDGKGRPHGCFTDHPGWLEIDVDSSYDGTISFKALGEGFDQYLIVGDSVRAIVDAYLKLTGQNVAMPIWAFGYQQSRWSYFTQNEVLEIARTFREKGIPCDVIYLDIDYMDSYKVFTWNLQNFPDYTKMLEELHSLGFKVVSILDPGVKVESGYDVFEEAKGRYFLRDVGGGDFEGAVWPGRVRFPDFLDPEVRTWWARRAERYLNDGIDGFWNDMNEIAIFATERDLDWAQRELAGARLEDGIGLAIKLGRIGEIGRNGHGDEIVHLDGTPHWKVKNVYGLNMQRAVSEYVQERGLRPFLITRSAYAGVQRYGGVWTGDNHSWWEHVLQETIRLASLGLCGVFYCGCDVGGFGADANAELLIRFTQLGAFSPMFRNHTAIGTRRQEPWAFGPEVEEIVKKTIELRYSLIPYVYTQYMMGVLRNIPLMRPLFYDFRATEALRIEDQFMFGDAILVAPVYRPNVRRRLVWFPKNGMHLTTGDIQRRGWRVVEAPLDSPVAYQLAGTAIPQLQPRSFAEGYGPGKITWKVFLNRGAVGYIYEDDGRSLDYRKGIYNLKKVTVRGDIIEIETINPAYQVPEREWEFEIFDARGNTKKARGLIGNELRYTLSIENA